MNIFYQKIELKCGFTHLSIALKMFPKYTGHNMLKVLVLSKK